MANIEMNVLKVGNSEFEIADAAARQDVSQLKEDLESVQTEVAATLITDTASGAIASFPDGADNVPVKSLTVDIEPVQDLHGQSNPYPAGGGKNLLENASDSYTIANATYHDYTVHNVTALLGQTLTFSIVGTLASGKKINIYSKGTNVDVIKNGDINSKTVTFQFPSTLSDGFQYLRIYIADYTSAESVINSAQLEVGSSATTFAPYSNICPISGHTSAVVTRTGKNVIGEIVDGEGYNANGEAETNAKRFRTNRIKCRGESNVVVSWTISDIATQCIRCIWDEDGNLLNRTIPQATTVNSRRYYVTDLSSFSGASYIAFAWYADGNNPAQGNATNMMVEFSDSPTDYEPYQGQTVTIDLDGTRYGGTLDVTSGVLTVTHEFYQFTGSETINGSATNAYINTSAFPTPMIAGTWYTDSKTKCDSLPKTNVGKGIRFGADNRTIYFYDLPDIVPAITDKASLDAWIASQKPCITYPIEAFTVQLTAQEVTTLKGQNNIWNDCGNTEVEYRADTKLYIQKVLNA